MCVCLRIWKREKYSTACNPEANKKCITWTQAALYSIFFYLDFFLFILLLCCWAAVCFAFELPRCVYIMHCREENQKHKQEKKRRWLFYCKFSLTLCSVEKQLNNFFVSASTCVSFWYFPISYIFVKLMKWKACLLICICFSLLSRSMYHSFYIHLPFLMYIFADWIIQDERKKVNSNWVNVYVAQNNVYVRVHSWHNEW